MTRKMLLTAMVIAFISFGAESARAQAAQAPCAPGITFGSLVNNVGVGYTDGRLHIGSLYAVCLPTPAAPGRSVYAYDPDGGGKLTTIVKRSDGRALNTYVWYAQSIGGLWELSRYKVVGGEESVKPLEPGGYVLEFAADDKTFYRFPFTVTSRQSDDPYTPPGPRYFLEGVWNDYGNIYYQRNDPASSLSFTLWVQDKAGREGKRSVPYELKLVRERDGAALASETATLGLQPRWLRAQLSLRPTGGDGNSYFKAGDLLREDGAYSLRLNLDGVPYGQYRFDVKGGRIQLQETGGDPSTRIVDYISGGRYTSWWVRRQGGK